MGNRREPSIEPDVYLPASVVLSDELNDRQKIIWGICMSQCGNDGHTYISNNWIAKHIGVSERTVQRHVGVLEEKGFLLRETVRENELGDELLRRMIPLIPVHNVNEEGVSELSPLARARIRSVNRSVTSNDSNSNSNTSTVTQLKSGEKEIADPLDDVFSFYRSVWQDKVATGTPPRRTDLRREAILDRLDEGYTVHEIKQAIMGCFSNDWNIEEGYYDLTLICRNAEKLEQYMQWYRASLRNENAERQDQPSPSSEPKGEPVPVSELLEGVGEEIKQRQRGGDND